MSTNRLPKSAKLLLAAPALAGAAASVANADIVYTSINGGAGVSIGSFGHLFLNLDDQTYHTGYFLPGDDFVFEFGSNVSFLPYARSLSSNRVLISGGYITKFPAGAAIDASSAYAVGAFMAFGSIGPWAPPTAGYVGLRFVPASDTLFGWADVSFSGSSLTVYGFAYDTTGAAINAGAGVPEPGETALLGALAAGSAAAFAARRKRKLARAA